MRDPLSPTRSSRRTPSKTTQSGERRPSNGLPPTNFRASRQSSGRGDLDRSTKMSQSVWTSGPKSQSPADRGKWSSPDADVPKDRRAADAVEWRLAGAIAFSGQRAVAHCSLLAPPGCIGRYTIGFDCPSPGELANRAGDGYTGRGPSQGRLAPVRISWPLRDMNLASAFTSRSGIGIERLAYGSSADVMPDVSAATETRPASTCHQSLVEPVGAKVRTVRESARRLRHGLLRLGRATRAVRTSRPQITPPRMIRFPRSQ